MACSMGSITQGIIINNPLNGPKKRLCIEAEALMKPIKGSLRFSLLNDNMLL